MKANIFLSILCGVLLCGCAGNGFVKFYRQSIPNDALWYLQDKHSNIFLQNDEVKVFTSNDLNADTRYFLNNGAIILGHSSFSGGCQNSNNAITQAKKIGATHILVNIIHTETERHTGSMPIPTTQTSTTQGNINAFGSGGYAFGNYNSTTTTSGTQYMPYSYNVYICDHDAIYFIFR